MRPVAFLKLRIERGKARKQPDVAGKTMGVLSGRAGIIGEGVQA